MGLLQGRGIAAAILVAVHKMVINHAATRTAIPIHIADNRRGGKFGDIEQKIIVLEGRNLVNKKRMIEIGPDLELAHHHFLINGVLDERFLGHDPQGELYLLL